MWVALRPAVSYCAFGRSCSRNRSGQHHRADLEPVVELAGHRQMLQDVAAKAADRAFLDRDHHFVLAAEAVDQIEIEWFGEAGVGYRR